MKTLLILAALLFVHCDRPESESVSPTAASDLPSIKEILANGRPLQLYIDQYESFRFSSQSTLSIDQDPEPKIFQGSCSLQWDAQHNYRFVRQLLQGETVELVRLAGKVYLRQNNESQFHVRRHEQEFVHWLNVAFREILALFEQAEFIKESEPLPNGSLECWSLPKGKLCRDPESLLPAQGHLVIQPKEGVTLQIAFLVTPARTKPVTIEAPTPVQR